MTPPPDYAVECGYLTAPAHHASKAPETVRLAVAIVYSNAPNAAKEPVVFLDGGPGAGSLQAILGGPIPFDDVLEDHDLVLFDQRGTGFSEPRPRCDIPGEIVSGPGGSSDAGRDSGAASAHELDALIECRARTSRDGLDLSLFTSAESAADVTSLREALGYPSWTLYGISYGTRYALATLRDHPAGATSVILDSVVPPQVDLLADEGVSIYGSLHAIAGACLAESDCNQTFGDIEAKELAILQRLDESPALLQASDGTSTTVSARLAAALFTTLLYSGAAIPYVPEIVQEIFDEDYSLFDAVQSPSESVIDEATYLSVVCAEEAPFSSAAILAEKSQAIPEAWRHWLAPERIFDACVIWDVPAAPALENDAVTSPVPTLVLSGLFDPVTPPEYGALAARTLSRSQSAVLTDQAHASSISPCGKELVHAFLGAPREPVDTKCADAPTPPFKGRGGFSAPLSSRRAQNAAALRFVTTRTRPPPSVLRDARFRASRLQVHPR